MGSFFASLFGRNSSSNVPAKRRNRAVEQAVGRMFETLEERRFLSVSANSVVINSIEADVDNDGGQAKHVAVYAGATVTVGFSYSASSTNTTGTFDILGTPLTSGGALNSASSGSLSILIPAGTTAGIYNAKVTVTNSDGNGTKSSNEVAQQAIEIQILVVDPHDTVLSIDPSNTTYNGFAYAESNITSNVTGNAEGVITYKFYSDAAGENEIAAPTNAGTYYVKGIFTSSNSALWEDAESAVEEFTISKATLTGVAMTQDALNIAKQGSLTIDLSGIQGLQGTDTLISVISTATYSLQIGGNTYVYQPTNVTVINGVVSVSYSLKGGTAAADALRLALLDLEKDDGVVNTSASKVTASKLSIGAEMTNYSFDADFFTKLFVSAK